MRIPLLRAMVVGALAALLSSCLGSDEPLIAGSPFSDSFAGTYSFDNVGPDVSGKPGNGPASTIRLRKDGADLAAEEYREKDKSWKPTAFRLRIAPWRGLKDQAIVQLGDGRSYTYLYYRAESAAGAGLWTLDCGKLPAAVRAQLENAGSGAGCKATHLSQIEDAIDAWLPTNPKPDYRVTLQDARAQTGKSVGDALSNLTKGATALGTDEILKGMRNINPTLSNQSDEGEDDPDSFGNRAAGPIGQVWAALSNGDFGGAWRVIWHSWIIYALIAFVIAMVLTRRCRPQG